MNNGQHTVDKIGGTSMSRFGEVMRNVVIGDCAEAQRYNRVLVVSAYGGITNLLLENKKTGAPGVYGYFQDQDTRWESCLAEVQASMKELNRSFESIGLDPAVADAFVDERISGVGAMLNDMERVRSYGHLHRGDYLPACREILSSIGEAHSAHNSALILQANGINAPFVDLTCWKETELLPIEQVIERAFAHLDIANCLPIVTGYVKCDVGIMTQYDRGYSEITFSKIAVLTGAREGIIHKEYHLSTGDPVLIGTEKVRVIGNTNTDIADQMADMNMEAIHSRAAKEMQQSNIPIRVKNAFEPDHPGTLISRNYVSPEPRVDLICGREDILAVEVHDPDMVGTTGYDYHLMKAFVDHGISYISKCTNANTITNFIPEKSHGLAKCLEDIRRAFPEAVVNTLPVAIVSVLGSNMKIPGFLEKAADAFSTESINILGVSQSMRQVNMQFIISREDSERAQLALHRKFVEQG